MRGAVAALLLAATFIAGCTQLPNFQRTSTPAPSSSESPRIVVPDIPTETPSVTSADPSSQTLPPLLTETTTTMIPATLSFTTPELATIRPGAGINNGLCTANFVFTSPDNKAVYIGTAAHCVDLCPPGEGSRCTTDGCAYNDNPLPLGTQLALTGATQPVTLVYSSWLTMKTNGETDGPACAYNDFALLQIDPIDVPHVSPAMTYFGGPTGMATASDAVLRHKTMSYGASYIEQDQTALHAKEGYVVRTGISPWTTTVFLVPPSIPGDSGSPVILLDGRALGNLASGEISPILGASGISSLDLELQYMTAKTGIVANLATSPLTNTGRLPDTEPTLPSWVPAGYSPH